MASEKKPIHSNQGQQLQRHKFTLLHFEKGLGLRRIAAMCQHAERVALSLYVMCVNGFVFGLVLLERRCSGDTAVLGMGLQGPRTAWDRATGPSQCYKYSRSRA